MLLWKLTVSIIKILRIFMRFQNLAIFKISNLKFQMKFRIEEQFFCEKMLTIFLYFRKFKDFLEIENRRFRFQKFQNSEVWAGRRVWKKSNSGGAAAKIRIKIRQNRTKFRPKTNENEQNSRPRRPQKSKFDMKFAWKSRPRDRNLTLRRSIYLGFRCVGEGKPLLKFPDFV